MFMLNETKLNTCFTFHIVIGFKMMKMKIGGLTFYVCLCTIGNIYQIGMVEEF